MVAQTTTASYKGRASLSHVRLYSLMPCICTRTSVRGHRIQRYFSPLTTRATFSPERLLSPPPSTLKTTFPLIEPASQGSTKESGESEIYSQLGVNEEEYSDIQVFFFACNRVALSLTPDRISCAILSMNTSS